MAFITLGEALDRVLEKLAVERMERKTGGKVLSFAAGKAAREVRPEREERLGCGGTGLPTALQQRREDFRPRSPRVAGHPMADEPGCDGGRGVPTASRPDEHSRRVARRPVGGLE